MHITNMAVSLVFSSKKSIKQIYCTNIAHSSYFEILKTLNIYQKLIHITNAVAPM